jgi:hypothetical protein
MTKRINRLVCWLLFLCLLFPLSCTSLDKGSQDESGRMSFVPEIKSRQSAQTASEWTRSVISGTHYPITNSFCVNADFFRNIDDTAPEATYIENQKISYTGGAWQTQTPYYWPLSGYMDFKFYSPFGIGAVFDDEYGVKMDGYSITHTDINGNVISDDSQKSESNLTKARQDFCCADQMDRISNAEHPSAVNPIFKHYLTQICFKVSPDSYFTRTFTEGNTVKTNRVVIHLDEIYLDSLFFRGDFKQNVHPQEIWTVDTTSVYNYVVMKREKEGGTLLEYNPDETPKSVYVKEFEDTTNLAVLVIPQDLNQSAALRVVYSVRQTTTSQTGEDEPVVESNYVTQTTVTKKLAGYTIRWEYGKKIVFGLKIMLDDIKIDAEPADWGTESEEVDVAE